MDNQRLTHEQVKETVVRYFTQLGFEAEKERDIQFGAGQGRNHGIADVVVRNSEGYWITIVECKQERIKGLLEGEHQLKSYLSATDTRFGILAASRDPADWKYFENLRSNVFVKRDRSYFHARINDRPPVDRPDYDAINQLKNEKEQLENDNKQLTSDNNQLKTDKEQLDTGNKRLKTDNKNLLQKIKFRTRVLFCFAFIIAACVSVYLFILRPMYIDPRYDVVRIIDGVTVEIKYKSKLTSVQLFGVNAPETTVHPSKPPEPYGQEAHNYLKELLLDDSIFLRFDEHMRDQYDRILGYVNRSSDGVFVNLEMLREGYAKVDLRYAFKYEELFTDYESRAKADRRGMWSKY